MLEILKKKQRDASKKEWSAILASDATQLNVFI